MNRVRALAAACALMCAFAAGSSAQAQDEAERAPGVMVIYDSSNSMWGELADGRRKYEAAREALASFLAEDFSDRELAFRAYGHRRADDCRDSELIADFSPASEVSATVAATAESVIPRGRTPIDWSLRQALADFDGRRGDIIVITDGIESCDADPCALAAAWAEQDVGVQIHVVGLGLDDVARAAMQCIADASGTVYRDAASAADLADGLSEIRQAALVEPDADPQPVDQTMGYAVVVQARNEAGEPVFAHAEVEGPDGESQSGRTDRRFPTVAGEQALRVGHLTRNGDLYAPVELTAEVIERGETVVEVEVVTPPQVAAEFLVDGDPVSGSLVRVYQNGAEVFTFRPQDTAFVNEGAYEFRAQVNDQAVTVEESFVAGDAKTITFELDQRVRQRVTVLAGETGETFSYNFGLWRDGEEIFEGHVNNGVTAAPGTYELRLDSELTPFALADFTVPDADGEQTIAAPAGTLVVRYQTPDGEAAPDNGYAIGRLDAQDREQGRRVYRSESRTAYLPGRYRVSARLSGADESRDIEIVDGEHVEIVFSYVR
ncbi:MAG: hypothetical protein PVI23_04945 [Maricaulaceae bacterium]